MVRYAKHLIAALVLALSVLAAAPAQAQSTGEVPQVYPQVGAPGARFGFIASGFRSRERVAVWVNYPDGRISDKGIENLDRATRQGRVSWAWTAPAGGPTGVYQMVARGISSGVEQIIRFEVRERPTPPPSSNIQPRQVRAGALVTFYASGFLLDEDVRVWANTPGGAVLPVELESKRLINGRVDGSWSIPLNAQPGQWQLVVHGVDSGIEQVLGFEVR